MDVYSNFVLGWLEGGSDGKREKGNRNKFLEVNIILFFFGFGLLGVVLFYFGLNLNC